MGTTGIAILIMILFFFVFNILPNMLEKYISQKKKDRYNYDNEYRKRVDKEKKDEQARREKRDENERKNRKEPYDFPF